MAAGTEAAGGIVLEVERPEALPRVAGRTAGTIGGIVLLAIALPCFLTLPWSLDRYDKQWLVNDQPYSPPSLLAPPQASGTSAQAPPSAVSRFFKGEWFGTDRLGQSLWWRCLLGGAISLTVGICAALISVVIGVTWGAVSGYVGGRTDALMMRFVDVLYGLPYILLVVLLGVAISGLIDGYRTRHYEEREAAAQPYLTQAKDLREQAREASSPAEAEALRDKAIELETQARTVREGYRRTWLLVLVEDYPGAINLLTLIIAIGTVSWLTMARVIRGQVLSLRAQPFVEAARACGVGPWRILRVHLLPNLIGPIVVYTTLTVPSAILQESFLSFLGIGVQAPLPSWGNLASDGLVELHTLLGQTTQASRWWLVFWPCALLGLTLLALNFLGDSLRSRLDPRSAG